MGGWTGTWNSWFGAKTDDPLANLDPEVRKFLEKESPVKVGDAQQRRQDAEDKAAVAAADAQQQQADAAAAKAANPNAVPEQSLYPDGRYAHLWKTYRPVAEIEAETKTDQEKLYDVLSAFKARKETIGAAAMENCAEEQMDWSNCMRNDGVFARSTMCSEQVRKFESCYLLQSKLLKALGYLNVVDSTPETSERIQLHADKLYHQLLKEQEAVDLARKEGTPVPTFKPVIPKQEAAGLALMSDAKKKQMSEKMDKMNELERAAEQAAMEAEIQAKHQMVSEIMKVWKKTEDKREARIERGEGTVKDKIASAWSKSRLSWSPNNEKD